MQYVHHLLIHSCDTLDGVNLTQGGPCPSVDRRVQACRIGPIVGAWAVGGRVWNIFIHFEFFYLVNVF